MERTEPSALAPSAPRGWLFVLFQTFAVAQADMTDQELALKRMEHPAETIGFK